MQKNAVKFSPPAIEDEKQQLSRPVPALGPAIPVFKLYLSAFGKRTATPWKRFCDTSGH